VRHFVGDTHAAAPFALAPPELRVGYDSPSGNLYLLLKNPSARACTFAIAANAYFEQAPLRVTVAASAQTARYFWLRSSGHWYDFSVTIDELPSWSRRLAGRVETGRHSISDPAQGGPAHVDQSQKPYP
jgi:phospholipase C